jgi:anti-sigma factor RsiW
MKTSDFEEQFTAWLDGQLDPVAASALEKEMRARGFDPAAERAAHQAVSRTLREHSEVPAMKNLDFFQHQLLHRIEQEQALNMPSEKTLRRSWLTIPRLVWAGALSLLMAGVLFRTLIPMGGGTAGDQSPYFATVVDTRTFEASVSVSTVYDPRSNVTVLWLDGLEYLPDAALQ